VTERIGKVETTMLNRAKIGIGVATIGMALSVIPALSASASVKASATLRSNALCGDYKSQLKSEDSSTTSGSALEKAYTSGKWSEIQKALLSSYSSETGAVNKLESVLSGAPSSVKSAAGQVLKFENSLKTVIQQSTSLTQFSQKSLSAEQNPKVQAALKTLDAYGAKECPGEITTTPTT
jgi:hypothetical protein